MIRSVNITKDAYYQMLRYVLKYANPDKAYRQWREVIGWLIGKVNGDSITVLQAIPMTSGSSIFVQIADYTILPKIAEEAEKHGAIIVGWFHSHPSFGFFLSGIDIRTQRYQQSLFENAIALVCDPTKVSETEPGIHGYQVNMEQTLGNDYRELTVHVSIDEPYPKVLKTLLLEAGITRSFAEVIAYEELAGLFALEGIAPPISPSLKGASLLPAEREAVPEIVASYIIHDSLEYNREGYLQIKISNVGEGIAFVVDFAMLPSFDFKLLSMYPRRTVDQLNYDSTIVETFKIKPTQRGEIYLPSLTIYYFTAKQRKYQVTVPAQRVIVE
ncbi:MAG: Mov34/MPN/PAD-1 family protein [Candidatus Heimdallarchaeota archaeon]|nr:MAG: hypothetical protein DRO91_09675 [Candidatus Heimdallarchaeota archaeon]RLI69381.1 MAG: hypothetical protein DRP02_10735 [Candidatus Gerdarchaeota archaeon]